MRTAVDGAPLALPRLPDAVVDALSTLSSAGHEAALVGGALRDLLLSGEHPETTDWDVATSAHPEQVVALFEGARWENRFGTVTVGSTPPVQITTYRGEEGYRDRRHPEQVRWGVTLHEDLARRDFTINALAWLPTDAALGHGRLADPYGGARDLRERLLRAVGDPDQRVAEDALRLLRAVRFTVRFDLRIEPRTEAALKRHARAAASLSGERVRDELLHILRLPASAPAFALMERLGLLSVVLPELAALRGVPQSKRLAGDALDHSLRTADALPASDPLLRLAGLLHDVGKAVTAADGHFHGHERVGAEMVTAILRRLRLPAAQVDRLTGLVRHHMFGYTPDWTDAAVRRFVRRVGRDRLDDLFALRAADDAASGASGPETGALMELAARVAAARQAPLNPPDLALNGDDLQRALSIEAGPELGRLIDALLEAVIEDPARNTRAQLLALARKRIAAEALDEGGAGSHHHRAERDDSG